MDADSVIERVEAEAQKAQAARTANMGPDLMRMIEKQVVLTTFDAVWKEHLHGLDQLRQGIGLRAYGQRDPLNEYKQEAFQMFTAMLDDMRLRVTQTMCRIQAVSEPPPYPVVDSSAHHESFEAPPAAPALTQPEPVVSFAAPQAQFAAAGSVNEPDAATLQQWYEETPRNALCPCGSGQKFKHCHGRLV